MKILCVGDVHGDKIPLLIAKEKAPDVDKIVFLGDYVDSFENYWPAQKVVLNDIISFKKELGNKVVLLLGNHDLAYFKSSPQFALISGHQHKYHWNVKEFLEEHFSLFDIFHQEQAWFFSHAGVSSAWLEYPMGYEYPIAKPIGPWTLENVDFHFKQMHFDSFNHHGRDPYGNDKVESCVWIRPPALMKFGPEGFNQVVGHTEFGEVDKDNYWGVYDRCMQRENGDKFVFIDSPDRNVYCIIDTETNEVQIETKQGAK